MENLTTLLLPILLLAVFYFMLIRPQQKQRRQIEEMQRSLQPGARVVTRAGLLATVASINDDEVVLEVAPGITNTYVRAAIGQVLDNPSAPSTEAITQPADTDGDVTASGLADKTPPKADSTNGDDVR